MAQVTYPGVYVEEVPSGVRPIAGVSTSVPGFIGMAEKGPIDEAVKVFNFTEYQNRYGGFLSYSYLSHAVFQFFNNGGTQCYIVRVTLGRCGNGQYRLERSRDASAKQPDDLGKQPGRMGEQLAVVITDGTNDPGERIQLIGLRSR